MVGEFFGKRYRVAGRVVLGMEERGQISYWTEFNLVNLEGESADLVFEETTSGPQWRLFVMFEPEYPITASDAATKRMGDRLNLDGTDVEVTLVSRSRIYHIEGQAAEGEEVGDVADYFNAKGGNTKIVVSWTGEEVECYRGGDISSEAVRSAFNIDREMAARFAGTLISVNEPATSSLTTKVLWAILVVALLLIGFGAFGPQRSYSSPGLIITAAPSLRLNPGATGTLNGVTWQVRQHALVQIAEVGRRYERHEYQLAGPEGASAMLVYGFNAGQKDWCLLTPVEPLMPMTAQVAAAKRCGETINVDGEAATVNALFETILRQTESAENAMLGNGKPFYGFAARSPGTVLMARWDEAGISFYRGRALIAKEVAAGFKR
jgi:hypothetical protein